MTRSHRVCENEITENWDLYMLQVFSHSWRIRLH